MKRLIREQPRYPALLLVFRFVDIRRTERLVGIQIARGLLRQAAKAFGLIRALVRESDILAHDPDSDDFIVLLDRGRDRDAPPLPPIRVRAIALRIEAILSCMTALEVQSGWTYVTEFDTLASVRSQTEHALARGFSERERIDFFAAIGHEMRTPLSSIVGAIEYLSSRESGTQNVDERKTIEILRRETARLNRLIESMVDLSMIDFPNAARIDGGARLRCVIEAAIGATQILAADRGVQIVRAPIPDAAIGVSAMIGEQIFVNLLENAVKHGKAGGRINVEADESAGMVAVHISDDGPGISQPDRTRVFEKGVRTVTEAGGRGLGLTFVRSAAEGAGGDVTIDASTLGGARLSVRLPTLGAPSK